LKLYDSRVRFIDKGWQPIFGVGLFPVHARLNHACNPSAEVFYFFSHPILLSLESWIIQVTAALGGVELMEGRGQVVGDTSAPGTPAIAVVTRRALKTNEQVTISYVDWTSLATAKRYCILFIFIFSIQ
jgi:hypothetical protein